MHRCAELLRRRLARLVGARILACVRRIAVGAPVALELTRAGVENRHPPVEVPVGDVRLVGHAIDEDLGHSAEARRVVAVGVKAWLVALAGARARATVLREELTITRELHDVRVSRPVPADPDVVVVVHGDAVVGRRPLPLTRIGWASPRAYEVAVRVELEHGRRGRAALAHRGVLCRAELCPSRELVGGVPLHEPDVIPRIDVHPNRRAHDPVVGQRFRPERIDLERRNHSVLGHRHVVQRGGGTSEGRN